MSELSPRERQSDGLKASPDDPKLMVSVLCEFMFCPRAGLCAFETKDVFEEDEVKDPDLTYMPRYEEREIKRALELRLNEFKLLLLLTAGSAVAGLVLKLLFHPALVFAGVAGVLWFGWFAFGELCVIWELNKRLKQYEAAIPREPDPRSEEVQTVHWWELLKAGFESVPSRESFSDEGLKLTGKPWRVLRRGELVIPVSRLRSTSDTLFRKHFVRAAAYCHLVQVSAEAQSPYGIVFFGDSYEGFAIPNSPATRAALRDALRTAREIIRNSRDRYVPEPPEQISLCSKCPHGEPMEYRPGESEHSANGRELPVVEVLGSDGKTYHSHCGDRFSWLPRHVMVGGKSLRLRG